MHLIIEIMQQTNINNCSWQLDLALWSAFTNVYVLEFLKRWTSISPRLSIGQISKSTGRTQCVENLLYTQVKRDECVPAVWILALYKGDGCLSVSATTPLPSFTMLLISFSVIRLQERPFAYPSLPVHIQAHSLFIRCTLNPLALSSEKAVGI